jgi:alanyl-tRNA synthetase
VFDGDGEVPFDREAYERWIELGLASGRIHRMSLSANRAQISQVLQGEEDRFGAALARGLREVERLTTAGRQIDGHDLFWLFETYGLPPELTAEELRGHGIDLADWQSGFERARVSHRERSRSGSGALAKRICAAVRRWPRGAAIGSGCKDA